MGTWGKTQRYRNGATERRQEREKQKRPGATPPSAFRARLLLILLAPQEPHPPCELLRGRLTYQMVEGKGFEPSTSALRTPRSPN
jgi:hypothetical protein